MKNIVIFIVFLCISIFAYAGEQNKKTNFDAMVEILAELEIEEMNNELMTWIDPSQIKEFSQVYLTDDDVKTLYKKFLNTIVMPPDPDTYKEYSIENGEESLGKVDKLGRTINSMLRSLPMENLEKYGYLLRAMRDVLYIDFKHIPFAINHNNARDYYWYELHNIWLEEAKQLYDEMFKLNTGGQDAVVKVSVPHNSRNSFPL
ncbi:hypothetical protein M0R36_01050 [bacterium]|jgi:hypothetical protein|nr:hypothetical protein [bacterium]